ncbi:ArsR/SmtB family transcription factor [Okibacterium fritillariae]|uniref:Helix-turn-helix domain-containing protein n=1 Tax=Okibacterium fritillariae TaxID=123320 RepID=A0A1T5IDD6_9MICO|nr:helix-turn-helix domain-containing protein [Okibacterium fritillariae]SKC37022.1 Helix-turn-helix domain-containing protein [Okibacterium fritillariae]
MSSLDELRATAHPIRLRLLSLLTGAAMSAAEAGRELGYSQATASYHLRVLERAGLVRVVETVRLRGGEAKRYRHESSAERFRFDDAQASASASASASANGGAGVGAGAGIGAAGAGDGTSGANGAVRVRTVVPSPAASSAEDRAEYVEALIHELRRRNARRGDGPQVSTDAELWVDPETWRRVVRHVGDASALLHAAAKPPRTPGTRPVSMTAALFPLKRS